ncbi:carboxyl transferase domain-containing protein [Thermocatellispora tengchongensis]|uniref:carboxyl transferase domain-containing protein n=1 Tax=Thermocatellispora tengchongensis TaxID=1073253 RepID=UPI00362B5766
MTGAAVRAGAREVIEAVVDAGSFESWNTPPTGTGADADYAAALARARERSGVDESVLAGCAQVAGRPVVLIVGEFGFLGGSIGTVAAERVVRAVERATRAGLPILASTASGGTRMQEGTPAFVRMLDIVAAIARHRAAGLPYLVHLRHPTAGGVMASWGALGQITLAEPGALLGFLGPRVTELLTGAPMPEGVQTAENLAARGHVDALVPIEGLRQAITPILDALLDREEPCSPTAPCPAIRPLDADAAEVWESVEATRGPDRLRLSDLYRSGIDLLTPLAGTGHGRPAVQVRLARVTGIPCVLIAQDRHAEHPLGPGDLRAAQRGMALAEEWKLPLITLVDTDGADLSPTAENGGLVFTIAQCMADLQNLTVPSVSVLLGQGAGGGALALLGGRHVVATQRSWLAPLPPEGASAIVHGDTAHAPELAKRQRIGAPTCWPPGSSTDWYQSRRAKPLTSWQTRWSWPQSRLFWNRRA